MVPAPKSLQSDKSGALMHMGLYFKIAHFMVLRFFCLFELFLLYLSLFPLFCISSISSVLCLSTPDSQFCAKCFSLPQGNAIKCCEDSYEIDRREAANRAESGDCRPAKRAGRMGKEVPCLLLPSSLFAVF